MKFATTMAALTSTSPAVGGAPALGGEPLAFGSQGPGGTTFLHGQPRQKCRGQAHIDASPTKKHHCWSWWKGKTGARLDLDSGEWDKDQFRAEVENHPWIEVVKDDRRKNFRLALRGNFEVIIGYSRHQDGKGKTHGWVRFCKGCNTMELKLLAVQVMLNCMGLYMADDEPASGGAPTSSGPKVEAALPQPSPPSPAPPAPKGRWKKGPPAALQSNAQQATPAQSAMPPALAAPPSWQQPSPPSAPGAADTAASAAPTAPAIGGVALEEPLVGSPLKAEPREGES